MPVVILLADGLRPDTLARALDAGRVPALGRLRDEGGVHTITSCFPTVTGPAYAPLLMGRFPGPIGLPGLRWFDRTRTVCGFPSFSRSYMGYQWSYLDRDMDREAPTIFELVPESGAALSMISRGVPRKKRIGTLTVRSAIRAALTHFRGDVRGWLDIDRMASEQVVRRVRDERPDFLFAAFTGIDKVSHAYGHESPDVLDALAIVDHAAEQILRDAERGGYDDDLDLWVASDHGHSPVHTHEDLAGVVAGMGHRTLAHPFVFTRSPAVAVMVSGNAMAHVYVDLASARRQEWASLSGAWSELLDALLARESVDLAFLTESGGVTVRSRARGTARITGADGQFSYHCVTGDPLGIGGDLVEVDEHEAFHATFATSYPDSIVQLWHLVRCQRAGDIVLSAAPGWDFRARFEPIPHVSAHGSLHRDHMLVPFIVNRPVSGTPRRTADVMPSALSALGLPVPAGLDGQSFIDALVAV